MIAKLFSRATMGYVGDDFNKLWRDINAWGADAAVHIHQDAGGGGRGYSVLYRYSRDFAEVMQGAFQAVLGPLGITDRGMQPRPGPTGGGVAVLSNATMPAVLCECGFYDGAKLDEVIGSGPYAKAIVTGIKHFGAQKVAVSTSLQGPPEEVDADGVNAVSIALAVMSLLSVQPDKKEDGMPRFSLLEQREGMYIYGCALVPEDAVIEMHYEGPGQAGNGHVYLMPHRSGQCGKGDRPFAFGGWDNSDNNYGGAFVVSGLFGKVNGPVRLAIHSPRPLAIEIT